MGLAKKILHSVQHDDPTSFPGQVRLPKNLLFVGPVFLKLVSYA